MKTFTVVLSAMQHPPRQITAKAASFKQHPVHWQEDDFASAWRLATVNRVDLNILVDYAWPRFLGRAEQFVRALNDDQAVCDVLAALREDSVAKIGGLYASVLPAPPPQAAEVLPANIPTVESDCPGLQVAKLQATTRCSLVC